MLLGKWFYRKLALLEIKENFVNTITGWSGEVWIPVSTSGAGFGFGWGLGLGFGNGSGCSTYMDVAGVATCCTPVGRGITGAWIGGNRGAGTHSGRDVMCRRGGGNTGGSGGFNVVKN